MKATLDQQLTSLPGLPRQALEKLWKEEFGKELGAGLRRENVVKILAYRLQEKALGGLKPSLAKQLQSYLTGQKRAGANSPVLALRPKVGTQIVREWNGKLHEVSVLSDGFEYAGNTYGSLSEIARVITGTRWSGPAFFGMKRRATKASSK